MPKWREEAGIQEKRGLDKYSGVISIWMTGVCRKRKWGRRECVSLSLAKETGAKGQRGRRTSRRQSQKAVTSGSSLKIIVGSKEKN